MNTNLIKLMIFFSFSFLFLRVGPCGQGGQYVTSDDGEVLKQTFRLLVSAQSDEEVVEYVNCIYA